MGVAQGQQYNIGEKSIAVVLYPYINRHAGSPKAETNDTMSLGTAQFVKLGLGSNRCQHYKQESNCQLEGANRVYRYVHGIYRGLNRQRLESRGPLYVDSYIQHIGCQTEKLRYTVAIPARGLLNREK